MKKATKQALDCLKLVLFLFGAAWAYQLYTVHQMLSHPLPTRDLGNGVSAEVWWEHPHLARVPVFGWMVMGLSQGVSARYRLNGTEYRQSLDIVEDAFRTSNMPEPIREVLGGR